MKKIKLPLYTFIIFSASCQTSLTPIVKETENISIDSTTTDDHSVDSIVAPFRSSMERYLTTIIGYSDTTLTTKQPEGNLGNFVADLLLDDFCAMKEYGWLQNRSVFTLINTRGLRAPISSGPITVGNIFEVMPFENKAVLVQMKHEQFTEVRDYLIKSGGHPVSRNIRLFSKANQEPEFTLNGKTPEEDFWIITSDYLYQGGDNMSFFSRSLKKIDTGLLIRDLILEHIRMLSRNNKNVNASIEGRITIQ